MIVPYLYKTKLEDEFESFAFPEKVNIHEDCDFPDFFEPNEYFPERVKPHLSLSETGILVSTGTERSFFDLIFSDETKCEGLVVVDVNPRIKAYVDFNVLLLRIAKTRQKYLKLSTIPQDEAFQKRIKKISSKILKSDLPLKVKEYFFKNLKPFASIYLTSDHFWRGPKAEYFKECRYDRIDEQFYKLQRYARSGNIIAKVGDINNLTFLKNRTVSVVDTSNILNYHMLNLCGEGDFRPRVIWTQITMENNTYRSYEHEILSETEKSEFNQMKNQIVQLPNEKMVAYVFNSMIAHYNDNSENEQFDSSTGYIFSNKTLLRMKEYLGGASLKKRFKSF